MHANPPTNSNASSTEAAGYSDVGKSALKRITAHVMPMLLFLYVLAYLDRANISVAKLGFEKPESEGGLGLTSSITGFATGLFFLSYWILEIPSTITVVRSGARWVFIRILVLWGLCATLMGFIGLPAMNNCFRWCGLGYFADSPEYQLYFFRFWLGFFEGGFFPSVIVYLSLWYPPRERGKAIAMFMAATPVSFILGSPLSGLILNINWFGLTGWRWVFILEGLLPVFAAVLVAYLLPNRPRDAKWLPAEERDWIENELAHEQKVHTHGIGVLLQPLTIVTVIALTCFYFCQNVASYGTSTFMPAMIKSILGTNDTFASVLASLPYILALGVMLLNGWHSDKTGEREWHAAVPLLLCGTAYAIASISSSTVLTICMLLLAGSVLYAHLPAFWPIPSKLLGTTAAASAIGFINMIGNFGGFYGPNLVGKAAEGQVDYSSAFQKLAPWPIAAAIIIVGAEFARRRWLAMRAKAN